MIRLTNMIQLVFLVDFSYLLHDKNVVTKCSENSTESPKRYTFLIPVMRCRASPSGNRGRPSQQLATDCGRSDEGGFKKKRRIVEA